MHLVCPDLDRHRADHGPVADMLDQVPSDEQRVVMLLAEGWCPACPTERLTPTTMLMFGRQRLVATCGCCEATWELDEDCYLVHDRGRLEVWP